MKITSENNSTGSQESPITPEGEPPLDGTLSPSAHSLLAKAHEVAHVTDHRLKKRMQDALLQAPEAVHEIDRVLLRGSISCRIANEVHSAALEILSHPVHGKDERIHSLITGTKNRAAVVLRQAGFMAG